jgi:PadR family transcriptional regulator PadR
MGAYPPTSYQTTPCVNRPPPLLGDGETPRCASAKRECEATVSYEKPKRARATPRGDTFEIGCRPKHWLEAVILLSLREWDSYGYELMARARGFGFEALHTGTLYGTLRRMEKVGVVESSWETSGGGPARRMYAMTDAGEAHLGLWAKSLEHYQHTINDFFRLYADKPPLAGETAQERGRPSHDIRTSAPR